MVMGGLESRPIVFKEDQPHRAEQTLPEKNHFLPNLALPPARPVKVSCQNKVASLLISFSQPSIEDAL